jgi:hypothetical protein
MSDGVGFAILIYSCGAFCVGIPLVIINLISVVILSLYYDQSQLAIWLATNTGITLGVCGIGMLVFLYLNCKGNGPSREELGTMCCYTAGAPCLLFFSKIGLNIWGIVELANYASKWNALSIFSTCIIVLQLMVYAVAGAMLVYRRFEPRFEEERRNGNE